MHLSRRNFHFRVVLWVSDRCKNSSVCQHKYFTFTLCRTYRHQDTYRQSWLSSLYSPGFSQPLCLPGCTTAQSQCDHWCPPEDQSLQWPGAVVLDLDRHHWNMSDSPHWFEICIWHWWTSYLLKLRLVNSRPLHKTVKALHTYHLLRMTFEMEEFSSRLVMNPNIMQWKTSACSWLLALSFSTVRTSLMESTEK